MIRQRGIDVAVCLALRIGRDGDRPFPNGQRASDEREAVICRRECAHCGRNRVGSHRAGGRRRRRHSGLAGQRSAAPQACLGVAVHKAGDD